MKKAMMMLAMLAVSFAMQAQTKFHDVELNDAKGPVKSIASEMMGRPQNTTFTQEGKMQREGMSDAKYDSEGFMQSAKMTMMQGQEMTVKYAWENGKLVSQTMNIMGNDMVMKFKYDEKGYLKAQVMDMGGQEMEIPYTDYKFDSHGNWISRKTQMMGQEREQTRTIEYYE